ncbi:MAG: helix-turn-helix transcriptional regulator [Bacillota bacterium]|nr:helix-turn-helix transcriptional regulator [Bacillota bacterium]
MDKAGYEHDMVKAQRLIEEMEDSRELQGEMLLVSAFEGLADFDVFCERLQQAARLMKGRSRILSPRDHMFWEFYGVFSTCNTEPGHADENAEKLQEAEQLFYRMTGGGKGIYECYCAQLACYRGEFDDAQTLAHRAIEIGRSNGQELVCLCAAEVLCGILKHTGDEGLWRPVRGVIRDIMENSLDGNNRKQAELCLCNIELSLGLVHSTPGWLRQGDYGALPAPWGYEMVGENIPASAFPMAMLMRIEYLSYCGKAVQALNEVEMIRRVYDMKSVVIDAYLDFLRAGCYAQMGDGEKLAATLKQAVEVIAPDKLWLIAAEFEPAFGDALYDAAAQVDGSAPARIRELGEGFWQKLTRLREKVIEEAPEELSGREQQVVDLLMKGRKNSEIAEALSISQRTVRSHLENIYRKLGVARRTQLPEAIERTMVERAVWVKKK